MASALARSVALASALLATSGCELFWSWDGVGSGGGSPDGGGDGGAGCSAAALLCEDFEDGFDSKRWQTPVVTAGSTVGIGTARHHSGSHALHAHVEATGTSADGFRAEWDSVRSFPPSVYLRMFVYPEAPIAGFEAFAEFDQASNPYPLTSLWLGPESFGWTDSAEGSAAPSVGPLLIGMWTCVEWEVDATARTVRVWVNGKESTGLAGSAVTLPKLDRLGIGEVVTTTSGSGAYDLWLDDVVVDTSRIECD
jgi:hypothetical protein